MNNSSARSPACCAGSPPANRWRLALDDLQWLDEGSAALLHFLCRTLETGTRMIFAGCARAGEVDDNPWAKGLLHSLAREGRLLRLPLAPLAVPEVAALLGPALAAMDPLAVARDSGGNPLFVLALANARDRARGGNGSHRTLDALIAERLDALEPASRELLLRGLGDEAANCSPGCWPRCPAFPSCNC
ncbi:hypothetical protein ACU4GD_06080 [Cupriavidus basilensis]